MQSHKYDDATGAIRYIATFEPIIGKMIHVANRYQDEQYDPDFVEILHRKIGEFICYQARESK